MAARALARGRFPSKQPSATAHHRRPLLRRNRAAPGTPANLSFRICTGSCGQRGRRSSAFLTTRASRSTLAVALHRADLELVEAGDGVATGRSGLETRLLRAERGARRKRSRCARPEECRSARDPLAPGGRALRTPDQQGNLSESMPTRSSRPAPASTESATRTCCTPTTTRYACSSSMRA